MSQSVFQLGIAMNRLLLATLLICSCSLGVAQESRDTSPGDMMLADYFEADTNKLSARCLADIHSAEDWRRKQSEMRRQLLEMLGLDPSPERTPLQMKITGEVEHDDFLVKNLQFQSSPQLYVTGNLYVPKEANEPLPAVLYVCGHGRVIVDGVSYGNKTYYQHHPAWFAQNGYVCLVIDTLQLGEIQGIHHGTYREGMWWWINRGYTPAGVEAWNCIRAVDLLQSLAEVDGQRIGVTGRSGGGVYSWWLAAIDERIKCAVPVAGITDLENHVVDGCVEGHCDCMYMVNTYQWDYPAVAALVAPRPLLISNTDSDPIFPLDGVYRTYEQVKRIYTLLGAKDNVALNITAGPHKDTQELRVHAFRWMNQHLKGDTESAVLPAEKHFEPAQLKVFRTQPVDQKNTSIHEEFVADAQPELPGSVAAWKEQADGWKTALQENVFAGWPDEPAQFHGTIVFDLAVDGIRLRRLDFESQTHVRLTMLLAQSGASEEHSPVELNVLDSQQWNDLLVKLAPAYGHRLDVSGEPDEAGFVAWARKIRQSKQVHAYLAPRGVGPFAWNPNERKQIQIRRRFYLLGQTRDGMRVFDVCQAVRFLQRNTRVATLAGDGTMAGIALYASMYTEGVKALRLHDLPSTHRTGPVLLGIRRYLDLPQVLAMAVASKQITLTGNRRGFKYPQHVAALLGRKQFLEFAEP